MVSEFLLNIVFGIVTNLLDLMPDVTWSVDTSAFSYFISIIEVCAYMLPMPMVAAVVLLDFSLTGVRIVIALIKTVWDLLPLA